MMCILILFRYQKYSGDEVMYELNDLIDLFFERAKHLFFPENWLQIDLKFSKSEIFALLYIEKKQEIIMTDLADYINAPMSTANGIVERLLKRGYLTRERSQSDRRIVVVRLTEEGTQILATIKGIASTYLQMALGELSEEEIRSMVNIFIKIVDRLQKKTNLEPLPDLATVKKIKIQ